MRLAYLTFQAERHVHRGGCSHTQSQPGKAGLKGDAFNIIQFTVGERIHRWACLHDNMELDGQHDHWDSGAGSWLGSDNPINGIQFLAMKLEKE
jgi:hypothetical protein